MILQDSQSKKIDIIFGPPGTGKTTHLLNIVEEELQKGTAPDKIGYFAFTKRAAREAIDRAMKKFNLTKKDLRYFRTLHSMAYLTLGLASDDVMGDKDYAEVSDLLQEKLINPNKSVDHLGISTPQDPFLRIIDQAKIKGVPLSSEFLNQTEHVMFGEQKLNQIAEGLKQYKGKKAKLDFTDMIIEFNLQKACPGFDVVIIDESQDLSFIQWQMVEILIRNSKKAFIAGDDDQAIFEWAGADTKRLQLIGGKRQVLTQSYRIPRAVHHVAGDLINKVNDRVQKDWNPKEEEGVVMRHRMRFNNHTDLTKGEWLILARTNYMLDDVMDRLKREGMFYTFKNRSSVSDRLIRAVEGWNRLKEGAIDLQTVKDIYYYISGSGRIRHGYKEKLKQMDPTAMYDYESLTVHHGLNVDINLAWDLALDDVPESMRMYVNTALRRNEFNSAKNIRVSTIHASKGSEADNVMLLTDLPRKADLSVSTKRDDERRVFYVGATRAKKSLHIIESKTDREFTELL